MRNTALVVLAVVFAVFVYNPALFGFYGLTSSQCTFLHVPGASTAAQAEIIEARCRRSLSDHWWQNLPIIGGFLSANDWRDTAPPADSGGEKKGRNLFSDSGSTGDGLHPCSEHPAAAAAEAAFSDLGGRFVCPSLTVAETGTTDDLGNRR